MGPGRPADVPEGTRGGVLLGPRGGGGRAVAVALVSTAVVFTALAAVIVSAPGWPLVQHEFFDPQILWSSLPALLHAFWINVQLFLVAEVIILVFGLFIAVLRSLPGPVFFPLRILATVYADVFRGLPGLLVIYVLGFGMPTLGLPGVPNDPFFWAVVTLALVYTAYVSEVYRAGIESVHPSQEAAARSLGLKRGQALRYVILPQAIRRVVPPLLNDFIGLQKDTIFVSFIGVVEVFRTAQVKQAAAFNFTPYVGEALIFLVLTIPLARFTDWLIARGRARQLAGGVR
ncbi:MAG: amino acid ABC transporter permease [Candidatus Limnocylindrales bacterium]